MHECMYDSMAVESARPQLDGQQKDAEDADPSATGPGRRGQSEYVRHHDPEDVLHSHVADQLDLVLLASYQGRVGKGRMAKG